MGRLSAAFSLRLGMRSLVDAPSGRMYPIDGLRALSVLWVVCFHSAWYLIGRVPMERYVALMFAPWMLPIWRGDFAVDTFFVLSGFLIGGMLVDERARSGSVRLGRFYARRLLRLWPALLVALALDQIALGDHTGMVWAPALYLTNAVSVAQVPMAWTWSLSIEEQFYLACPFLLAAVDRGATARRLGWLALVALGLAAIGALVVSRGGFRAIDAEIVMNREVGRWIRAHDALYSKPWMRAGPLIAGVAAAILHRDARVMLALARSRLGAAISLVLALGAALGAMHWPLFAAAPRAIEIAYLAGFRTVYGAALGFLMLLVLSTQPLGAALGRALSWRGFRPIARLAYSAYLLNPIVTMLSLPVLLRRAPASDVALMLGLVPAVIVASFAAALPLYLFVERPFMELRGREATH